jgi:hypothetical protein
MSQDIRVTSTTGLMTRVLGEILRRHLDIPWGGRHGLVDTFKPEHWTFRQASKWNEGKYLHGPEYTNILYQGFGGSSAWNKAIGQLKMRAVLTEYQGHYLPAPDNIYWDIQIWVLMPDGEISAGRFRYWLVDESIEPSSRKILDPTTRPDFWRKWDREMTLPSDGYTPEQRRRLHEQGYWGF